jgi:hypothetical protein
MTRQTIYSFIIYYYHLSFTFLTSILLPTPYSLPYPTLLYSTLPSLLYSTPKVIPGSSRNLP